MKAYRGNRGMTALILNLGTREVSGELHALAGLPLGKVPPVPIEYKGGWAPELLWMFWRRGKSLAPAVN
jgi:hypothetical protein